MQSGRGSGWSLKHVIGILNSPWRHESVASLRVEDRRPKPRLPSMGDAAFRHANRSWAAPLNFQTGLLSQVLKSKSGLRGPRGIHYVALLWDAGLLNRESFASVGGIGLH